MPGHSGPPNLEFHVTIPAVKPSLDMIFCEFQLNFHASAFPEDPTPAPTSTTAPTCNPAPAAVPHLVLLAVLLCQLKLLFQGL